MIAHNLPRPGGQLPPVQLAACSSHQFGEMIHADSASQKFFIDRYLAEGLKLDYWWMDAGWYPCTDWPQVGTWEPDTERFPNGLKALSEYVHAIGSQLIVWFEPERVAPDTWLYEQHPEWLLTRKDVPDGSDWARHWRLLDLGNPAARTWLTDHVDRLIAEQGIDLYRQDFNIDPLGFWQHNDAPDRQGMTENLYIQGYLAYWDELRRRHPSMLIDSCASGGRRNDLETLRRSVPLLRSDYQSFQGDPAFATGNQGHTYALAAWFPYFGQGVYYGPDQFAYSAHSHMCPAFCMAVDVRKAGIDWDLYRRLLGQWREVADFFLGDYYPLTPYSLCDDAWMAWQFHLAEKGAGMVQVFRHSQAPAKTEVFRLHGLDRMGEYIVAASSAALGKDAERAVTSVTTGQQLMEEGLKVMIPDRPGVALVTYRRQ